MPFRKLTAKKKKTTSGNGTRLINGQAGLGVKFHSLPAASSKSNQYDPPIQLVDRHISPSGDDASPQNVTPQDSRESVDSLRVHIEWQIPPETINDSLDIAVDTMIHTDVVGPRIRPAQDGFNSVAFDTVAINRLISPTALLDDTCINGCAALLYSEFNPRPRDVLVISSYIMQFIRQGASDDVLWRNTKRTKYWEKPVWILPIHRPTSSHWVMCRIDFTVKRIDLFDSFSEHNPWRTEIEHIKRLIGRLSSIALSNASIPRRDLGVWTASPVLPRQSNGYDCGVWVLAQIAAVLRGAHVTNLTENDMPAFRRHLYILIRRMPLG
ncbi:hypothetical protein JVT61DRAFT_14860 [Boletus reticuloceps]|uniref:Ubiquitin-like protease family profile domain-containing protein n=1 Tax=Boletus reticuloceps TaxID=495285 RepID=A0A8I2YCM5_9AGAM|nr:hypothetical protein JVT61DRAFT_14860 [Boletus reticuloceps]